MMQKLKKKKLTQKRLKELLKYDPQSGTFYRRHRILSQGRASRVGGKVAGWIDDTTGYRRISIDSKIYTAARLAFLYMEGYFPENDMDHIDRCRSNNKWNNLRHVSTMCNLRNASMNKRNTSGITGVCKAKSQKVWRGRWISKICVEQKTINLGTYGSKEGAVRARWEAEKKYGFPTCNTTSSAYLYLKERGLV